MDSEVLKLLKDETVQRREEGCDVAEVKDVLDRGARGILEALSTLSVTADFPYKEPSNLPGIRAERREGPGRIPLDISDTELDEKIYGGWLGRCAGCLLGKPVEGFDKDQIEKWLQLAGAYPLRNYFPPLLDLPKDAPDWLKRRSSWRDVLLGHITRMARDDDIDYMALNLRVLETSGFEFTVLDVGKAWLSNLCYSRFWPGVRIPYRNFVNGLVPPETATYMNPYREWIGAHIRADMWGYVTPGMPEFGAELAYRDASFSNVKNAVYAEMFVSAMISAAFTTNDIEQIIQVGLSEIPKQSRLAETVKDVDAWSSKSNDWRDTWQRIREKYGHYHHLHTINNLALVLLGLLHGKGDYEKSICIAVMGGWDTDCNGATVGSVLGVVLGAKNLPAKWVKPLNDRAEIWVHDFRDGKLSDLAKRTSKLAKTALNTVWA